MNIALRTRKPFSFAQTVAFVRRFPPCQGDYLVTDDAITAAVTVGGRARAFTLRGTAGRDADLTVDVPDGLDPAARALLVARAAYFVSADDDLTGFYAAAESDAAFLPLRRALDGLHHVRFLTLEEIAVYCVLMQRTPIRQAAAMKRRFLAAFGLPVEVGGARLLAMPEMDALCDLDERAIAAAIGHRGKAATIAGVVRGVAALGEPFLRTAPYAAARDALLDIPGIGPFSAAAILLRGLGRMDELPAMRGFTDEARAIYGEGFDERTIARRYGAQIGYWSYYLKAGSSVRLRPVV
jgi:DNA-3-methyladenine glycosylase II